MSLYCELAHFNNSASSILLRIITGVSLIKLWRKMVKLQLVVYLSLSMILSACGGGGGSFTSSNADSSQTGSNTGSNTGSTEPTGNSKATISWSIPSARESGAGLSMGEIAGYKIFYGSTQGSLYSVIDVANASTTSYELTNLVSSTKYYFQITAYDINSIESEKSNIIIRTSI